MTELPDRANAQKACDVVSDVAAECWDASAPFCLKNGGLDIGTQRTLLGVAECAPAYEMLRTPQIAYRAGDYALEIRSGLSIAFSLAPDSNTHFALNEMVRAR